MFRFENPDYIYLLILVPIIIVGYWLMSLKAQRKLNMFASDSMLKIIAPSRSLAKQNIKFGIIILAFVLIVLSVANPQVGAKIEQVKQVGIDIYILLDVSKSMAAQDIEPSRLEKSKYEISKLIQNMQGDRIGLIVSSGDAFIQFPLTSDYSAAGLFLNSVDFTSVPTPGTAIERAISLAANSFQENVKTKKAIIILTDGEDHEGNIDDAVAEAVDKGIQIFCIGVGSENGAPVPITDKNRIVGYKKDQSGNVVISKLDESTLRNIASKGNGKFYRSTNNEDELEKVFDDLAKIEKNEYGVARITDYEDRYYYLLFPAIVLLMIEIFLSYKKSEFFLKFDEDSK